MCLITFMKNTHPEYPLILIGNRDESPKRPSLPIHRWEKNPNVTAGIDLKGKGTWLGYTKDGKFITILNYPFTDWEVENPRSRGQLLKDYLTKDFTIQEFEEKLITDRKKYDGYHLIYGRFDDLRYYSNIDDTFKIYKAGLHSVSNTKDDLSKHRMEYSSQLLDKYVKNEIGKIDSNQLVRIMQNKEPSTKLKDYPNILDYQTAKKGSSIFIESDDFTTVATTIILLDNNNNLEIKEIRYKNSKFHESTQLKTNID